MPVRTPRKRSRRKRRQSQEEQAAPLCVRRNGFLDGDPMYMCEHSCLCSCKEFRNRPQAILVVRQMRGAIQIVKHHLFFFARSKE